MLEVINAWREIRPMLTLGDKIPPMRNYIYMELSDGRVMISYIDPHHGLSTTTEKCLQKDDLINPSRLEEAFAVARKYASLNI
jgi:hypothetical protein